MFDIGEEQGGNAIGLCYFVGLPRADLLPVLKRLYNLEGRAVAQGRQDVTPHSPVASLKRLCGSGGATRDTRHATRTAEEIHQILGKGIAKGPD